jgi:hypothetical protein
MSGLWTPGGDRPVEPDADLAGAGAQPTAEQVAAAEELAAEMADVQRQLAETPAVVVITNHAIGLFQLAALHLNQRPPNLDEGKLALDERAHGVEGMAGRLGEEEETLRQALSQARLAFVQLKEQGETGA